MRGGMPPMQTASLSIISVMVHVLWEASLCAAVRGCSYSFSNKSAMEFIGTRLLCLEIFGKELLDYRMSQASPDYAISNDRSWYW